MEDIERLEKEGDEKLDFIKKASEIFSISLKEEKTDRNQQRSKLNLADSNRQRSLDDKNLARKKTDQLQSSRTTNLNPNQVEQAYHSSKIERIIRKFNNEYLKSLKHGDKKMNKKLLDEENELYNRELSNIKVTNRDKDLLVMQKENQEIEKILKELKEKDKTELNEKEEESRKLVEELNLLFMEKKEEALEKDKERKAAIEEIKLIKKQQRDLEQLNKESLEKQAALDKEVESLDTQVKNYEEYKKFIEEVIKNSNDGQGSNDDYDTLKTNFENLIERMNEIKKDIADQENIIKEKKKEQMELLKRNDKQQQNQKLLQLEEEARRLTKENKELEKNIEEIMSKNQKKESDNHQIRLSILNLYRKVISKDKKELKLNEDIKEAEYCKMLDIINEKMNDLIEIYKELEKDK